MFADSTYAGDRIRVRSSADVAVVVTRARRVALEMGFSEEAAVSVATAASELATNVLAHAGGGVLDLQIENDSKGPCFCVLAEDRGPGIADVAKALQPGYSTAGGLGLGLPGVQRLMDELTFSPMPGAGIRVQARKYLHGNR